MCIGLSATARAMGLRQPWNGSPTHLPRKRETWIQGHGEPVGVLVAFSLRVNPAKESQKQSHSFPLNDYCFTFLERVGWSGKAFKNYGLPPEVMHTAHTQHPADGLEGTPAPRSPCRTLWYGPTPNDWPVLFDPRGAFPKCASGDGEWQRRSVLGKLALLLSG